MGFSGQNDLVGLKGMFLENSPTFGAVQVLTCVCWSGWTDVTDPGDKNVQHSLCSGKHVSQSLQCSLAVVIDAVVVRIMDDAAVNSCSELLAVSVPMV